MPLIRHILLLACFSLLIFGKAEGFNIRCASVGPTGDVTLTWDRSGTTITGYRCFYIYHSNNQLGPFTAIDSIFNYADTIQTDPNALAATIPAYYYIAIKFSNGNVDLLSDTVRAIGLNVVNPGIGYANLSWNALRIPLIATNSIWYQIYREYPAGFFTLIDSVNASTSPIPMTYSDQISVCDDTIKYKIQVMDQSGCISVSSVKGDRFRDLQPPQVGVIDSVSVDAAGNAIITWLVDPSPDTKFYIVLQGVGNNWVAIDTVVGRPNTILNSIVNCDNQSEGFQLIVVDSCNNPCPQSLFHSTIHVAETFDACSKSVTLSWNAYIYWPIAPKYEILRSVNGGAEVSLGITTSTSFTDTSLISGSNLCYRVRAIDQSSLVRRTSTSNQICVVPAFPPPPTFSYIRKVTVTSSSNIFIEAFVDPFAIVSGYQLLRSTSAAGPFSRIASKTASGVSTVTFNDGVDAAFGPYYYKVQTIDSCGVVSKDSQISHTILLTGEADSDYTNTLDWRHYGDWLGNVDHYNIYRRINGVLSPLPLASFAPGDSTYLDEVLNEYASDGNFCYVVEAIEGGTNPYFFLDSSRSNEICLVQQPIVFMPNAFHPGGGFNDIFYPSNAFVSAQEYSFRVFDRWGEMIFETNDPVKGWDGSTNGVSAPQAVYVYLLKARNPDGTFIEKKGSLTLIR